MHEGLCATNYHFQSKPHSYPRWYKRSIIKKRINRNFNRHCGLSFEAEIWHWNLSDSVSNVITRNDQYLNPLSANPTKLSNTLKQLVGISCLKGWKYVRSKKHLKVLCREKNINIIDHGNTTTVRHLNLKGNKVLTEKFQKQ